MHAIKHIGDGVTALVHQQGKTFFRIMTGNLGMLQLLAKTQVFHHPVHHQGKHVPIVIGDHTAGSLQQGSLDGFSRKGVFQQNHRHRLTQALEMGHGGFEASITERRPTKHQLPGSALESPQQVIFAQRQLRPGRPTGIAQHIHQLLSLIL